MCNRCCSDKDSEWKCFHKEFYNSTHAEQFRELISHLEASIGSMLPLSNKNDLFCIENPNEEYFGHVNCMHFNHHTSYVSLKHILILRLLQIFRKIYCLHRLIESEETENFRVIDNGACIKITKTEIRTRHIR